MNLPHFFCVCSTPEWHLNVFVLLFRDCRCINTKRTQPVQRSVQYFKDISPLHQISSALLFVDMWRKKNERETKWFLPDRAQFTSAVDIKRRLSCSGFCVRNLFSPLYSFFNGGIYRDERAAFLASYLCGKSIRISIDDRHPRWCGPADVRWARE